MRRRRYLHDSQSHVSTRRHTRNFARFAASSYVSGALPGSVSDPPDAVLRLNAHSASSGFPRWWDLGSGSRLSVRLHPWPAWPSLACACVARCVHLRRGCPRRLRAARMVSGRTWSSLTRSCGLAAQPTNPWPREGIHDQQCADFWRCRLAAPWQGHWRRRAGRHTSDLRRSGRHAPRAALHRHRNGVPELLPVTGHGCGRVPVFRLHRWVGHVRLVRRRTDHLAAAR